MFPSPTSPFSFALTGQKRRDRNFKESGAKITKKTTMLKTTANIEHDSENENILRDNDNIWGDSDTESDFFTPSISQMFSTPERVSSRVGRTILLADSDTESECSEHDFESVNSGSPGLVFEAPYRVRFGRMKAVNRELSCILRRLAESVLNIAEGVDASLLNIDEPFFQNNRKRMAILSAEVTCKQLSESLSKVSTAHLAVAQLLTTLTPTCEV
jgi:hypothetical protein